MKTAVYKDLDENELQELIRKYYSAVKQGSSEEQKIYESITDGNLNPKYIYLFQGIRSMFEKEMEKAIKKFDKALEEDPSFTAAITYKGEALANLNQNDLALKCFDKLIEINPYNQYYWYYKEKLVNFDMKKICNEAQDVLEIIEKHKKPFSLKEQEIFKITEKYPNTHPAKYLAYEYLYNQKPDSINNFKNYGLVLEAKDINKARNLYQSTGLSHEMKIYSEKKLQELQKLENIVCGRNC
ncbi:MAG: tetratricopeptide repeat protein [Alphaproteobacteria bacterium]